MTNIEPLGARVLVKILEQESMTASGIVLPDTAKEKPQQGIVEAIGTEEDMVTDLKEGDKVLFAKYSGTEIKQGDDKLLLLNEDDVLARIND